MPQNALILVDFQKEWIDSKSDYFVGDISDVVEKTNRLIAYCRERGDLVIFTQHVDLESEDAFAPDSASAQVLDELKIEESDILITKNKISPFYKTNLESVLGGVSSVVVCGILTNLCVRSVVQDAYDRDFEITVITDCCVAFDIETQAFTFKDLKATREEICFIDTKKFFLDIP